MMLYQELMQLFHVVIGLYLQELNLTIQGMFAELIGTHGIAMDTGVIHSTALALLGVRDSIMAPTCTKTRTKRAVSVPSDVFLID